MPQMYSDSNSVQAPARMGRDVVAHATNPNQTRFVMVSVDNTTITGVLEGDTASHTTFGLKAGVLYPIAFKTITAISGGAVKAYL